MDVTCKCGYHGDEFVEYTTSKPYKAIIHYSYGYRTHVKWLQTGSNTLNWACPKCGRILVYQYNGLSYDQHELKDMRERLRHNSGANERWLKDMEKVRIKLKELSDQVAKANKIAGVKLDA